MVQYFPIVTGSLTVTGSVNVSGSITTNSTITATTLVVQTITSSISAITGSTNFGSLVSNTHTFTGSLNVTGALAVTTNGVEFQVTNTGVNLGNALTDSHIISGSLRVNPSGLFVSSSGIVGIGTTNPSYTLDVTGTSNFTGALRTASTINMTGTGAQLLQTTANSVAGDNVMVLYNSNANSYGLYIGAGSGTNHALYITDSTRTANLFKVQGNGNVGIGTGSPVSLGASYTTLEIKGQSGLYGGAIQLTSADGTNKGRVYIANDNFWIGTSNSLPLGFITNDTERMTITNIGQVLINTNATVLTSGWLCIAVPSSNYNAIVLKDTGTTYSSGNYYQIFTNSNNGIAGGIVHNSASTVSYYTGPSDARLKSNIQDWTQKVLPLFADIKPKTYNHIEDNDESVVYKGYLAQDMVDKFPEAYGQNKDGYYTFNPNGYIVYLVKAIQELTARVQELENK